VHASVKAPSIIQEGAAGCSDDVNVADRSGTALYEPEVKPATQSMHANMFTTFPIPLT
jgi:hypothetical protein